MEGFGLDHNLGVFNNSVDAIGRALTERYFFVADKANGGFREVYQPTKGAFNKPSFKRFRDTVMDHMPLLPRLSRQQVVDRYTGSKKRVYTEAMLSLTRRRLTEEDARLKMFVKFEKQDLGKAPRGINPRDPRYNLELGRYIKHAEKPFFKAINKAFGAHTATTVIKGLNANDSASVLKAKWDRFANPVAIGLDAEKFDAHVSVDALKYEHTFYTRLHPGQSMLKQMLKWQLHNKGTAYASDGKVKFEIAGTRSSGDLNTSLGNCLIMCGAVHAYSSECGVEVELANNGDDCVVFMEAENVEKYLKGIPGWFKKRGFSMVAEEPVYEFEQIEFCQTKPVLVDGAWRMVRNHVAVFKKDPMCLIAIQNANTYRKWLYAVGECGSILNDGVPVQSAFYNSLLKAGVQCSEGMMEHIYKGNSMYTKIDGLTKRGAAITPEARVSYYYAFGIMPDEQVEIERCFGAAEIAEWTPDAIARDALVLEPGIKILSPQ